MVCIVSLGFCRPCRLDRRQPAGEMGFWCSLKPRVVMGQRACLHSERAQRESGGSANLAALVLSARAGLGRNRLPGEPSSGPLERRRSRQSLGVPAWDFTRPCKGSCLPRAAGFRRVCHILDSRRGQPRATSPREGARRTVCESGCEAPMACGRPLERGKQTASVLACGRVC